VPKGGPDGGDGGDGGSVYFAAEPGRMTLMDFKYRKIYRAGNGGPGRGKKQHGKKGEDLRIPVPVGTTIRDASTGEVLADLIRPFQEILLARGGRGGRGNCHFASATVQTPLHAEEGGRCEEREIRFELKLIADVGLVGLPNAGKSTLLSRISAARPKIADYAFTTLHPVLGVVGLDTDSFVVADIPGIIEGAHEGKGLGISFLRHIERTALIAVLIDVASPDPVRDYRQIREELRAYSEALYRRHHCVVLTKCDLLAPESSIPALPKEGQVDCFPISAVTGQGLDTLVAALSRKVKELKAAKTSETAEQP